MCLRLLLLIVIPFIYRLDFVFVCELSGAPYQKIITIILHELQIRPFLCSMDAYVHYFPNDDRL